jgi:hypothetical protein
LHDLHDKAPSRDEARRYLEAEIHEILAGNRLPANPDGEIELWQWDRTQGLAVPVTMPASRARAELANQLADRLLELSPDHRPYRQLYLMTLLEAEAYRVGRDKSLTRGERTAFDLAAKAGPTAVEDALSYALASGRGAAAAAAAQVLGEIAGASMLTGTAQPAPLAQALTSGDARVRFAAAQAIVHVKPTTSFPGLSHLKSELVSIARWSGQPHALVGFPNSETVQEIAGLVNAVGFESDTATNGHDLMIMAVQPRRYDLIVVSSRMDRGPLYLILQDLRNHPTTAQTPIIVLAEDDELGTLRDRWRDDPLTTVVFRPRELDGMNNAVQQSQRRASDLIVPLSVRGQHAAEALRMMSELNDLAPKLFNFRDREDAILPLLYLPTLGPLAADVASDFGTHASQQALLAIVNRASQPLASRQAAATAFAESVRDFGVRLTKDEIVSQYRRYNESEFEEAASQALLGAVLDAIELPTRVSRK